MSSTIADSEQAYYEDLAGNVVTRTRAIMGGTVYSVANITSVRTSAGLPRITFHDLRHTAATTLLALNVHPKAAQERLGHSSITTTLDLYSHAAPTLQEQAVTALDERFGRRGA